MPFAQNFQPTGHEEDGPGGASSGEQSSEEALDEIDRILHQMLLLSELSASDANVDRSSLQKVLERMKTKIDHIADQLE